MTKAQHDLVELIKRKEEMENYKNRQIEYWQKRCEAVEKFISLTNKPYCYEQDKAFEIWKSLKQQKP